ncbi:HlyD family type I secretion periplasmic adaptor subunit [Sedimentimonas flavescens]|uniref:Membrane fusion protein (MFP) family protein n=1 Tax=Sedimentimonas flavescens TaxID=2851012 RepID=A0ABT3A195_9RHOB|nr:HlyD family type I secretion periplasmic adaptor subunit [Sedimentimonas flavescens]MCV2879764.1 HlyD family type I secretion periplasmic adaptor subunit [Sedimentimonas flavescens]
MTVMLVRAFTQPSPVGTLAFIGAAMALLFVALSVRSRRVRSYVPVGGQPLEAATLRARVIGFATIAVFFGLFGLWSWYAPLASAALAPGVVNPDGARKTVQHLEGGIIRTIHVREGDRVAAGATLVTLDNVRVLTRLNELRERQVVLLATEARLATEEIGQDEIAFDFPAELQVDHGRQIESVMQGQTRLFENRRETQLARRQILSSRIEQLREEIIGLDGVIASQNVQLELLRQEIGVTEDLYKQGLQRLSPLLVLQRQEADLMAEQASHRANIARLKQQIGETELQLQATDQQALEEVSTQLADVRAELAGLRSQLPERLDALARSTITAPIGGQVLNLQVTTESGGILKPGGDILDIVPDETNLIIDARLRPQDIDAVRPGMPAQVILTAYTQRNLPRIFGTLRNVSADRLTDERTGEPYFLAQVVVPAEELEVLSGDVQMSAGMPADVMILTGERTLFDFLLKPFSDSIRASFRER